MLVDFARTPSQTPIIRGLEFFNRLKTALPSLAPLKSTPRKLADLKFAFFSWAPEKTHPSNFSPLKAAFSKE